MSIGILECGAPPESLRARFGGYGAMIQRMLGPGRDGVVIDVPGGTLSAGTPDCDAYVLTGSAAGVHDDLPWVRDLIGFLRQVRGRAKLVGVCFGHQAMAEAFGGSVVRSPKGWGIGMHRYDVRPLADWMDGAEPVHVPAIHQDQVVACPPGARVTVASAFTPYAGLDYGDAISFQFHPEFETDFCAALLEARRDRFGARTDPAIASLSEPDDRSRVARWIARFLDASASRT